MHDALMVHSTCSECMRPCMGDYSAGTTTLFQERWPHGRRGGDGPPSGAPFLLVVPPLCVREVEFAYLQFCQFISLRTQGPFGFRFLLEELNKDWGLRWDAGRLPIGWCIHPPPPPGPLLL